MQNQTLRQELLKTVEMSKITLEQPKNETIGKKCDKYFEIIERKCFEQSKKGFTYFCVSLDENSPFCDGIFPLKDIQKYCELFAHENDFICWKIMLYNIKSNNRKNYVSISWCDNWMSGSSAEQQYINEIAKVLAKEIANGFEICDKTKLV